MSIQLPLPNYPSREEIQRKINGRFQTKPTDSPLSLQSVSSDGTWVTANGPFPTTPPTTTRESVTASPFPSYAPSPRSSTQVPPVARKSVPAPLKASGGSQTSPAPISNPSLVVGLQALANTFTRLADSLSMAPPHTLSPEELEDLIQEYERLPHRIARLTNDMLRNVEQSVSELQITKARAQQAERKLGGESKSTTVNPKAVLRRTSESPRQVRRATAQILDSPSSSRSGTPVDEYVSSSDSEYEQTPLPRHPPHPQVPQHKKPWADGWSPYFPEEGDDPLLRKPLAPRQTLTPLAPSPGPTTINTLPQYMTSTKFDKGVHYPNLLDVPVNVRPRPRFGRFG